MTLSGLGGLLLVFGLIAQNSGELGHVSVQGKFRALFAASEVPVSRRFLPCPFS
jgi:hypothetical protein